MYGALSFLVYFSKPRSDIKRAFALYLVMMFFWSLFAILIYTDFGYPNLIIRWMGTAAVFSMLAIFNFVQTFFGVSKSWAPYVYIYGVLAGGFGFFTDTFAKNVVIVDNLVHYDLVPSAFLMAGPGYLLMYLSVYEIYRGYKITTNATQKNRFRYLLIALVLIIFSSLLNFTPLGRYPIDIAVNGIAALLISYSILKHNLIEIQVVIRTGLFYTMLTAIVGAVNYLAIFVAINAFGFISNENLVFVSISVAIVTSALLTPMRDRFQDWLDRLFYRTKYNANEMLERLSRATASILDLDKITGLILDEIQETMLINNSAIFIKRESSEYFEMIGSKGYLDPIDVKFRLDNPVIMWLGNKKEVLQGSVLATEPRFKSMWHDEQKDIENINGILYLPIVVMGNMLGILVIGPKKSEQMLTSYDQSVLSTLSNQIAIAIENAKLYEELEDAFIETITTLADAIDIRDSYTSDHSQVIASLARDTAKMMDLSASEVNDIYWAGLLHDVGKIGIPDAILLKPGKLTNEEWEIMKKHTVIGAELAAKIKKLERVAPLIRSSHERIDGTGYPDGLKESEIPIGSKIISIVDAYSAMMDDRVYCKAKTKEEAVAELLRCSGTQFDEQIVKLFVKDVIKKI
jgi:putative nucleotidyltransferase with HDIG domain